MNKKNPTIIDVAKLANVGTMSVSRFFKNNALVSPKLQRRISEASLMRRCNFGETNALFLKNLETLIVPTFASLATSIMVGFFLFIIYYF